MLLGDRFAGRKGGGQQGWHPMQGQGREHLNQIARTAQQHLHRCIMGIFGMAVCFASAPPYTS